LLGGSEGGDMMSHAAPGFAAKGYVTASVAYFGLPGLPSTLENIPVETVGKALDDIAKRSDVDPARVAIMGISKGGEFALLAASTYPQIHAVIADVPSPFAWQGIAQGPSAPASSWTLGGKPVPYVPYGSTMGQIFMAAFTQHKPLDLRPGYVASMRENKAEIASAMFKLENIRGPVMMLGADDDQIWDSDAQAEIGMQYLHEHHHPYADVYLHYPGAGHIFLFASANRPMTQAAMGPFTLLLGGSAQTNTAAAAQAWPRIYEFLDTALQAGAAASSK
jgi:dienelactone hydrolase